MMAERAKLIPQARGRVLELGIGTGLNLPFYDATKVTGIFGVDPAVEMHKKAHERAAQSLIPIQIVALELAQIAADDHSFDTAVTTFTLCTIPDAVAALEEIRRVLKPEGELLFCEHGLSPDAAVHAWQQRLSPLWKPLAGGCHLDRDIPAIIEAGGFRITEMEKRYLKGPKAMTYVFRGRAVAI
jgi:ubiquinone/menaquinone biosynthesis C-methylase UbiE